jgi:hypothetical protein
MTDAPFSPELVRQMSAAHKSMEASFNASMGTEGWVYRDLPLMSLAMWDELFTIIGDSNVRVIISTRRGDSRRGQVLISPDGLQRMRDHALTPTAPKES